MKFVSIYCINLFHLNQITSEKFQITSEIFTEYFISINVKEIAYLVTIVSYILLAPFFRSDFNNRV